MNEEDDKKSSSGRRSVLTHLGAVISGWFLGTFLDPLRRGVNSLIADTPFGRKAQVNIGYAHRPKEGDYLVQIGNSGKETAEDVSIHIGFDRKITDYQSKNWTNAPPLPNMSIKITDGGVARINIDSISRNPIDHGQHIFLQFNIDEEAESDVAFRIDEEKEEMFTAYQYSWTFLGERYYESTDHHIVRVDDSS